MRSSDDDARADDDDDDDDAYDARDDDDDEDVVVSQRDVKAANIASLVNGTLTTCARPYVRGLTVEDPAVVLKRAFISPFPNAPNRSGACERCARTRAMGRDGEFESSSAARETGHPKRGGDARCRARRLTMKARVERRRFA